MKPTLLVLAAGMGSRYGGLKQIDSVSKHGEAIIDYSVFDAIRSGFGKVVFLIRKDIESDFKHFVGNRFENKINVEYAYQEISALPSPFQAPPERQKPWGTGHAILCAKDKIREPFAVINGDDFYGPEAFQTISSFLQGSSTTSNEYAMVGYILRNTLSENGTVSRGVCTSENNLLQSVVEKTKIEKRGAGAIATEEDGTTLSLSGDELVSLNFFGFTPTLFHHLETQFHQFLSENLSIPKKEFYIPSVVDRLIRDNSATVKMLRSEGNWFGITYKEDKPFVVENIQKLIKNGLYPEKLWEQ